MHSDLDQAQRDEMMFKFKSGQIDVLVATDILSRGIDIDDITMVINYDVPHDAEDYVHRIGRTARADRDGVAITLISDDDIYNFQQIEKFLGKEIEKVPLPEGIGEGPEYKSNGKGRGTSAKVRRRKARDQQSHKDKKVRNNKKNNRLQSAIAEPTGKKTSTNAQDTNENKPNEKKSVRNKYRNKKDLPTAIENKQNRDQNKESDKGNMPNQRQKNNGNVKSANNKAKSQQYKNANRDADTKQVKHNKKKQNFVEENNPRRSTNYEIKNEKSESRLKSLMKKPLKWLSKFGKK